MKKILFLIILFVIVLLVAGDLKQGQADRYVITMDSGGFHPASITIRTQDSIRFENSGDGDRWPASNNHPTHDIYPGFDAGKPIAAQDTWDFVFTKEGSWNYHDHLHPEQRGVIIVTKKSEHGADILF